MVETPTYRYECPECGGTALGQTEMVKITLLVDYEFPDGNKMYEEEHDRKSEGVYSYWCANCGYMNDNPEVFQLEDTPKEMTTRR